MELTEEDRREMAEALAGDDKALSPVRAYSEFRVMRKMRALVGGGDHLFVDLRRTRLHPVTLREVRTLTPVRPPLTLELGGQELALSGMILHCAMHYLALVRCRKDGMWDLLDDQHPDQRRRFTAEQMLSEKALLCHVVLLSYCAS